MKKWSKLKTYLTSLLRMNTVHIMTMLDWTADSNNDERDLGMLKISETLAM